MTISTTAAHSNAGAHPNTILARRQSRCQVARRVTDWALER